MKVITLVTLTWFIIGLYGCALFSYTNKELAQPNINTKATLHVAKDRGKEQETLLILALSGGGSRSAYFSASIMLALESVFTDEGLNLLDEVDIISSVSGGSLPAAYYVISKNPEDTSGQVKSNRDWEHDVVLDLMSKNYRGKWLGNWFWPSNIAKYWFTAFDRSDIMAQTFADNMFDEKGFGFDLKFKDINPDRPYIVLNSTNGTTGDFSDVFTFTKGDFEKIIRSDINEYEIARAVMATASFPAAFNYMTLKNYHSNNHNDRYVHVFDGGNSDNLGLKSVEKIIDLNKNKYKKIVVILTDAYTLSKGVSPFDYDGRKVFDYGVDLNFIDSSDSLLSNNRIRIIRSLVTKLDGLGTQYEFVFHHIQFNDIVDSDLKNKLHSITTDFRITEKSTKAIEKAVSILIVKDNACLIKVKEILMQLATNHKDEYCTWPMRHIL